MKRVLDVKKYYRRRTIRTIDVDDVYEYWLGMIFWV